MSGPDGGKAARGGLRGLSGVLVGGMVATVVALVVAWLIASRIGEPGPGSGRVLGHAVAAVVAVAMQVYADRTPGGRGTLGAVGAIAVVTATLVVAWVL